MRKSRKRKICKVEECNNTHEALGYCMKHYQQYRAHGESLESFKTEKTKICKIDGCNEISSVKGLCDKHYRRFKKHGNPLYLRYGREIEFHGMKKTPEYIVWKDTIQRCYNRNHEYYHRYGGRGIIVCNRWRNSFIAFYKDMGKRPFPKAQIDRMDNDGNYEPENCHWTTAAINARNRSSNKLTMAKAEEIRKKYRAENISYHDLAMLYGIGICQITRVVNLKCWVA